MNKKLLAVAIAGAFVAPVAMADTSNVTIYGVASMSVDSVDGGAGGTPSVTVDNAERRGRVSSNTSYIGFKGMEDLGNGLDAHFQIENQVAMDTSGAFAGARNTFLGIGSKTMGTLDFGLIDSPLKTSTGKVDLFGGGHYLADYRSLFATRDTSVRATNSVMYTSPNFSGFQLKLQTAAQQESGSSRSPSFWGAGATYENGPIFAALAYEHNKKAIASGSVFDNGAGVTGVGGNNVTTSGVADAKFKTWRAAFGYNFGVAKVGAAYQSAKLDVGNTTGTTTVTPAAGAAVTTAAGANSDFKRNSWHLSGSYNITPKTLLGLQYTKAGKISTNVMSTSSSGASQVTFGVNHAMSKRTNVYALYTKVSNQSNASYSLGGGASGVDIVNAAAAGEDPRGLSIGMIHKF